MVSGLLLEKVDAASHEGLIPVILQRQESDRGCRNVRGQVLAEDVRVAVVPAACHTHPVPQDGLAIADARFGALRGYSPGAALLQCEQGPRCRFPPAEGAVNPRPSLQRVVLTLNWRRFQREAARRDERVRERLQLSGGSLTQRQPCCESEGVERPVRKSSPVLDEGARAGRPGGRGSGRTPIATIAARAEPSTSARDATCVRARSPSRHRCSSHPAVAAEARVRPNACFESSNFRCPRSAVRGLASAKRGALAHGG